MARTDTCRPSGLESPGAVGRRPHLLGARAAEGPHERGVQGLGPLGQRLAHRCSGRLRELGSREDRGPGEGGDVGVVPREPTGVERGPALAVGLDDPVPAAASKALLTTRAAVRLRVGSPAWDAMAVQRTETWPSERDLVVGAERDRQVAPDHLPGPDPTSPEVGDPVGAECLLELAPCRRGQVTEHLLGCREGRFQRGVQTLRGRRSRRAGSVRCARPCSWAYRKVGRSSLVNPVMATTVAGSGTTAAGCRLVDDRGGEDSATGGELGGTTVAAGGMCTHCPHAPTLKGPMTSGGTEYLPAVDSAGRSGTGCRSGRRSGGGRAAVGSVLAPRRCSVHSSARVYLFRAGGRLARPYGVEVPQRTGRASSVTGVGRSGRGRSGRRSGVGLGAGRRSRSVLRSRRRARVPGQSRARVRARHMAAASRGLRRVAGRAASPAYVGGA